MGEWVTSAAGQQVTWAETGSGIDVDIYYSGTGIGGLTPGTLLDNETVEGVSNDITVPAVSTQSAIIRVQDDDPVFASRIQAESVLFDVYSGINISAPTGASKWTVGAAETINWTVTGDVANVNIEVDYGLGAGYEPLGLAIAAGAGGAGWPWPGNVPDKVSNAVKIKITFNDYPGEEDYIMPNAFTIMPNIGVSSPPLDQQYVVGTAYTKMIQWTYTGTQTDFVKIYYNVDAGGDVAIDDSGNIGIADGDPIAGGIDWTPPLGAQLSSNVKIKVMDAELGSEYVYGQSSKFKLRGGLTLNNLKDGETIPASTDTAVNFSWAGTMDLDVVKASYDIDSGLSSSSNSRQYRVSVSPFLISCSVTCRTNPSNP